MSTTIPASVEEPTTEVAAPDVGGGGGPADGGPAVSTAAAPANVPAPTLPPDVFSKTLGEPLSSPNLPTLGVLGGVSLVGAQGIRLWRVYQRRRPTMAP